MLLLRSTILLALLLLTTGCFKVPLDPDYAGPTPRPAELDRYYNRGNSYYNVSEQIIETNKTFTHLKIRLDSDAGCIEVDYLKHKRNSDDLILVFPVLGGSKNLIAGYFAKRFAMDGYDTAVVNRQRDFKQPEFVDHLEEILRETVVRDRIALDFFENEYGKKDFGSFGISRGGINVAATAGVDERLKYNVMAMGGADIPILFRDSDENRIQRYKRHVMEQKGFSEEGFHLYLQHRLRTDPKKLAQHIDAKNALVMLALFDTSVPIKSGRNLRDLLGKPKTLYLFAGHRTSILYTQLFPLILPLRGLTLFPQDYVETEARVFFDERFERDSFSLKHLLFETLQLPFNIIERTIWYLF